MAKNNVELTYIVTYNMYKICYRYYLPLSFKNMPY